MKRKTARQLVTQLSDLRHQARCSALRAAFVSAQCVTEVPGSVSEITEDQKVQRTFHGVSNESRR
jgi:hypothetical protein